MGRQFEKFGNRLRELADSPGGTLNNKKNKGTALYPGHTKNNRPALEFRIESDRILLRTYGSLSKEEFLNKEGFTEADYFKNNVIAEKYKILQDWLLKRSSYYENCLHLLETSGKSTFEIFLGKYKDEDAVYFKLTKGHFMAYTLNGDEYCGQNFQKFARGNNGIS